MAVCGRAFTTVLRVQVDLHGQVTDVHIDKSSGIVDLDGEAMDAYRIGRLLPPPPSCGARAPATFQFRIWMCLQT